MATLVGPVEITISVRRKPILYAAAIAYLIDNNQGGRFHRLGNWLVDRCVLVIST